MKLVIIAGGKGTRLGFKDIPKPMAPIDGKPLLEHQINLAKTFGLNDIYILSGYLSNAIGAYFGDGSAFGVNITHIVEEVTLGTAGAVKQLENRIHDRFMVFYGDVIFNIDLEPFIKYDEESSSIATIIVHPNDHPYDSDLIEIDAENAVTAFHSKPHDENGYYRNLVNAAVYILSPEIFKHIPAASSSDFGKDIFPVLLKAGKKICAYKTAEYLKDMGTADRLERVENDFVNGRISRFTKTNERPAIFMDRDGTLIKYADLLCRVEDVELFPFTAASVKRINNSGFICFLVTNQPVVARNICDISCVNQIHNKIETLLGREHAYLNDIYFCPHHPDKGYPEENQTLKVDCECRKPKLGMIEKAMREYNIDMELSWFIGDTTVDVQTGKNAGLKTVLVRTGKGGRDMKFDVTPDFIFDNLKDAVEHIITEG